MVQNSSCYALLPHASTEYCKSQYSNTPRTNVHESRQADTVNSVRNTCHFKWHFISDSRWTYCDIFTRNSYFWDVSSLLSNFLLKTTWSMYPAICEIPLLYHSVDLSPSFLFHSNTLQNSHDFLSSLHVRKVRPGKNKLVPALNLAPHQKGAKLHSQYWIYRVFLTSNTSKFV
jgi:hypothetical protein